MARDEMKKMPSKRPTGVTVLSILGFLLSLLMVFVGIASVGLSSFIGSAAEQTTGISGFGSLFVVLGIIMLVLGVIGLIAFFLLWKMKKSGMILVTVVGVVSIIMSIVQFSISSLVTIVIWLIIIFYLFKKKNLFV